MFFKSPYARDAVSGSSKGKGTSFSFVFLAFAAWVLITGSIWALYSVHKAPLALNWWFILGAPCLLIFLEGFFVSYGLWEPVQVSKKTASVALFSLHGAIGVYIGALLHPDINGYGLLIIDTIFVWGTSLLAVGGGWTLILVGVFMGMVPSLYGNFWEILGLDDRLSFHLSLFEGLSCALLKRTLAAFYDNYEKLKETIQENKARLKKITDELLKPQRILMEVR